MREHVEKLYEALCEIYGINNRCWDILHLKCNQYNFCKENRESIIEEYITLRQFVRLAKLYDIPYYKGIDEFLEVYKKTIEPRINLGSNEI